MKNIKKNEGFTLLEILLYMVIATIVLFAIMSFSMQIFGTNSKSLNMQEIGTNMDFISNKISTSIQSASSINVASCVFDNDAGKLSLNMTDVNKSPTEIYMQGETIYLKEGAGNAVKINSDFVKCAQLKFTRITQLKTPDMVIVDMECEPIHDDMTPVVQKLKIHTSISLRR